MPPRKLDSQGTEEGVVWGRERLRTQYLLCSECSEHYDFGSKLRVKDTYKCTRLNDLGLATFVIESI